MQSQPVDEVRKFQISDPVRHAYKGPAEVSFHSAMASKAFSSLHQRKRSRASTALRPDGVFPSYLSLNSLIRLQSVTDDPTAHPDFVDKFREHRDAADLAIFAHNASLDDTPYENDQFHPAFHEFRKITKDSSDRARIALRMRRAVQDQVRSTFR